MFGLEKVLLRALEVYLGKYVESLNKEQLKVGILKGRIALTNIRLKRSALQALGIPLAVKDGVVEDMVIHVPWAKLSSESVVIEVNGVHAKLEIDMSESTNERKSQGQNSEEEDQFKLDRLEAAELLWSQLMTDENGDEGGLVEGEDAGETGVVAVERSRSQTPISSGGAWSRLRFRKRPKQSFKKKLLQKVIDNLSIKVKRVKIEFSDQSIIRESVTGKSGRASANWMFSLHSFHLYTANLSTLQPDFFVGHAPQHQSKGSVDWRNAIHCKACLVSKIMLEYHSESVTSSVSTIFNPVDIQVQYLRATTSQSQEQLGASLTLSIRLSPIELRMNTAQLSSIIRVSKMLRKDPVAYTLGMMGSLRPQVSAAQSPSAWWKYAVALILHGIRAKPKNKSFHLIQELQLRSKYISLYKQKLHTIIAAQNIKSSKTTVEDQLGELGSSKKLSKSNKKLLTLLEAAEIELPMFSCLLYRQMAYEEYLFDIHTAGETLTPPDFESRIDNHQELDVLATQNKDFPSKSKRTSRWFKSGIRSALRGQGKSRRPHLDSATDSVDLETSSPSPPLSASRRKSISTVWEIPSVDHQQLYEKVAANFSLELQFASLSQVWSTSSAQTIVTVPSVAVRWNHTFESGSHDNLLTFKPLYLEIIRSAAPSGTQVRFGLEAFQLEDTGCSNEPIIDINFQPRTTDQATPFQSRVWERISEASMSGPSYSQIGIEQLSSGGDIVEKDGNRLMRKKVSKKLSSFAKLVSEFPTLTNQTTINDAWTAFSYQGYERESPRISFRVSKLRLVVDWKRILELQNVHSTSTFHSKDLPLLMQQFFEKSPSFESGAKRSETEHHPPIFDVDVRNVSLFVPSRYPYDDQIQCSIEHATLQNIPLTVSFNDDTGRHLLVSKLRQYNGFLKGFRVLHNFDSPEKNSHLIGGLTIPFSVTHESGKITAASKLENLKVQLLPRSVHSFLASQNSISQCFSVFHTRSNQKHCPENQLLPRKSWLSFDISVDYLFLSLLKDSIDYEEVFTLSMTDTIVSSSGGTSISFFASQLNVADELSPLPDKRLIETCDSVKVFVTRNQAHTFLSVVSESITIGWNEGIVKRITDTLFPLPTPPPPLLLMPLHHESVSRGSEIKFHVQVPCFRVHLREEGLGREFIQIQASLHGHGQNLQLSNPSVWVVVDGTSVGERFEIIGTGRVDSDPVLKHVVESQRKVCPISRINISPQMITFEGLCLVHFQAVFKEMVDFAEFSVRRPFSTLLASNSVAQTQKAKGTSKSKLHRSFTIKYLHCRVVIPASRSTSQHNPRHGSFVLGAKKIKTEARFFGKWGQTFSSTFFGVTIDAVFPLGEKSVNKDSLFPEPAHVTISQQWRRKPFAEREIHLRQKFQMNLSEGIRSLFQVPSTGGFQNRFRWKFVSKSMEFHLSQKAYHLFNIVLSENFTDWRYPLHTCTSSDWAYNTAPNTRKAPLSNCYCEQFPLDAKVVELVNRIEFPKSSTVVLMLPGCDKTCFSVKLENYIFNAIEWLRIGREIRHSAQEFKIVFENPASSDGTFSTILDAGISPTLISLRNHKRETCHSILIDQLKLPTDFGRMQLLIFFFDGNHAERLRMHCPTSIGPDPVKECRPASIKREVVAKSAIFFMPSIEMNESMKASGSLKLVNVRNREQQRFFTFQAGVDQLFFEDRQLIVDPFSIDVEESKIQENLDKLDYHRRFLVSVSPMNFVLSQRAIIHSGKILKNWNRSGLQAGRKLLRRAKRHFFSKEEHQLDKTVHSTAVIQMMGIKVLVQDSILRPGTPLFCFCSSPFIFRDVSETLSGSGRKITTYEGDFTDIDPSSILLSKPSFSPAENDVWCGASEKLGLIFSYFNMNNSSWEPVVEPFKFEWTFQKTSNLIQKEPSSFSVKLEAVRPLNFTFSYQLVKSYYWMMAGLKAGQDGLNQQTGDVRADALATASAPFVIENKTGCLLSVREMKCTSNISQRVLSGSRLFFSPLAPQKEQKLKEKFCLVSIEWPGSSDQPIWHSLEGVRLDRFGTFVYNLYPTVERERDPDDMMQMMNRVAIEITPNEGRVFVIVRSIFKFRNSCNTTIEVLLLPELDPITNQMGATKAELLGPLQPGEECFLPIAALHCTLSVRPYSSSAFPEKSVGAKYDWWQGVQLRLLERADSNKSDRTKEQLSYSVMCEVEGTTSISKSFFAALQVGENDAANTLRARKLYNLILLPTVMVENLLPSRVNCWTLRNTEKNSSTPASEESFEGNYEVALPPGRVGHFYIPTHSWFRFRTEFSSWTEPWRLDLEPFLKTDKAMEPIIGPNFVVIVDRNMQRTKLMVEVSETSNHSFRIVLYCNTWLLNLTGMTLSFRPFTKLAAPTSKAKASVSDNSFSLGEQVMVEEKRFSSLEDSSQRWTPGIVFQRNDERGTFDVLFENGELELDVASSRLNAIRRDGNDVPEKERAENFDSRDRSLVLGDEGLTSNEVLTVDIGESSDTDTGSESEDEYDHDFGVGTIPPSPVLQDIESSSAARWEDLEELESRIMLFSESSNLVVRFPKTDWSAPLAVENLGTRGALELPVIGTKSQLYYEVGVEVSLAPSKFRRTRVVSFVPRFVIQTSCEVPAVSKEGHMDRQVTFIKLAQSSDMHEGKPLPLSQIRIGLKESRPLWLFQLQRTSLKGVMCISLDTENGSDGRFSWSGSFSMFHELETSVKIRDFTSGEVYNLRLEIAVQGSSSVISISFETIESALYRIENLSSTRVVHFYQHIGLPKRTGFTSASMIAVESAMNMSSSNTSMDGRNVDDPSERARFFTFPQLDPKSRGVMQRALVGESVIFGWDVINLVKQVVVLSFENGAVQLGCEIDALNQTYTLKELGLEVSVYFDGKTKVIVILDLEGTKDGQLSSRPGFWTDTFEILTSSLVVQVCLSSISVSVVDTLPQEILLISVGDVVTNFFQQPSGDRSVEVTARWVQVDNQLPKARLPVVASPFFSQHGGNILEDSSQVDKGNFLHLSLVERSSGRSSQCVFFEYVGFLMQQVHLEIELAWLIYVWKFVSECQAVKKACEEYGPTLSRSSRGSTPSPSTPPVVGFGFGDTVFSATNTNQTDSSVSQMMGWVEAKQRKCSGLQKSKKRRKILRQQIYFDWLEIHPIKAVVKFQNLVESAEKLPGFAVKQSVALPSQRTVLERSEVETLQDLGVALDRLTFFDPQSIIRSISRNYPDIDGAIIFLGALVLTNSLLTPVQVKKRVGRHFSAQGLSQVYRLVGSSELFGNPIGLVVNLGSGLRDLFYEPAQGLVRSPEEFGAGLARGTRSFVHHTTVGTLDSISKLTSSIGTGFAMLSLDQRFLEERRAMMVDEDPRHVGEGVLYGAKRFGTGLTDGLSGIILEPIRGAEESGVEGFFKGLGIGLLGIAVKPAVGMFDMVAKLLAGVKNTASFLVVTERVTRRRLPRSLFSNKHTIQTFDPIGAFVQLLLIQTWGVEKVRRMNYLSHIPLPGQMLLVYEGNTLGCIDYSRFWAERETVAGVDKFGRALLLWSIDVRTVLQVGHKSEGVLSIELSDNLSATCVSAPSGSSTRLVSRVDGSCELILEESEVYRLAVERAVHDLGSMTRSELLQAPRARANFGVLLCPVPSKGKARVAVEAVFDSVGYEVGAGLVEGVEKGSQAEKAGLCEGDLLVGIGGCSFQVGEYGESLSEALEELPPDSHLSITIFRNGRWLSLDLLFA